MDYDSPVDRVCSRSGVELSAGRLSPLRSALLSYPAWGRQEVRDNISEMTRVNSVLQHF